ncbi:hypothetical protein Poli38472_007264 [Pythium oligandrum]|uniref:Protochlorophyllide reductase n=1 Tax=Pythium oligandrum TaxID=41045 RepID=A0A8K1C9U5_PYTOL|nr:hypothetical protein Poli38472_007264 [Pythium oligandrum]|eukprot:TMW59119.1 hypothetical protein Poli38472_007264 [Pythium oligandrum]
MATVNTLERVVLVTGGNTGIGLAACKHLIQRDNTHVLLTGRNQERVNAAVEQIRPAAAATSSVEGAVLDLGNLNQVRDYCDQLKKQDVTLDAIVCNAAIAIPTPDLTEQGYGLMFTVNHLGHFLLVNKLRDVTKRVIVVTSETHDPAVVPGMGLNVEEIDDLVHARGKMGTGFAYPVSKLCNLLFTHEFLRRFPNGPDCVSYTPGFTPDTSLSRHTNMDKTKEVDRVRAMGVYINTSEAAGQFLAGLASDDWATAGWKSGMYFASHKPSEPSQGSKDETVGRALWEKSEELLTGLL